MMQPTPPSAAYGAFSAPAMRPPVYSQWPKPVTTNRPNQPAIPDAETVTTKLTTKDAVNQGIKNGLIFGLLGGLPLAGLEHLSKTPHFLKAMTEAFRPLEHYPHLQYSKWNKFLNSTSGHLISTMSSLSLLGAFAGGTLGWWMIGHVKDRLLEINQVKQAQAQGTFTPKKLTLAQRIGLAEKPVDDPEQAYQDLLANGLNPSHAFQQGVKDVLILKVIKGAIPLSLLAGFMFLAGRGSLGSLVQLSKAQSKSMLTSLVHPVVLAKMAALPIIGGFIAQKFVPWMRTELGIANAQPVSSQLSNQQASLPIPTSAFSLTPQVSAYRTAAI